MRQSGVGIVDYGSGNIGSLWHAIKKVGYRPKLLKNAEDFEAAKVIVIPGVGAFPAAMSRLKSSGFDVLIKEASVAGKRIVGICLGMHLLANHGLEISPTEGLGLIPGTIRPHPSGLQVGWLPVTAAKSKTQCFSGQHVYFNHYFYFETSAKNVLYARVDKSFTYPAIVRSQNIFGIQFHPEKSQHYGLDILSSAVRGDIN